MMTAMLTLIAAMLQAGPARETASPGTRTVITLASGGGLREWQRSPAETGTLFVKDRNERWYKVTLTGPCPMDRPLDTLTYTTDANGTFDRFSRIRLLRYPEVNCGVQSIVTSQPPPGRRGAKR